MYATTFSIGQWGQELLCIWHCVEEAGRQLSAPREHSAGASIGRRQCPAVHNRMSAPIRQSHLLVRYGAENHGACDCGRPKGRRGPARYVAVHVALALSPLKCGPLRLPHPQSSSLRSMHGALDAGRRLTQPSRDQVRKVRRQHSMTTTTSICLLPKPSSSALPSTSCRPSSELATSHQKLTSGCSGPPGAGSCSGPASHLTSHLSALPSGGVAVAEPVTAEV